MPCADCLEQQKILIRLTAALNEREQQNQELTNKFQKYKLQTKAKFAQLRHQILDNVGNEDVGNSNGLSNLLLRLDETEGQLIQFKDQIDDLKIQLDKKDKEKMDYESQIKTLQQKLTGSGRKTKNSFKNESASSEDDQKRISKSTESKDQIQQMYAQLVYKDSKIIDLSRHIDEQEQKIMDWQEACKDRDEVNKAKTKAIQILQEQLSRFINKKHKDQATETGGADSTETLKVNQATSANASPAPGRAVAFYKDNAKKDDEESSFTTDITANDLDAFDIIRNESTTKDQTNVDKLNNRLTGLLQQVESMQRKVIKNELAELQDLTANANQPMMIKKKKDKKVTFDFSEQQRSFEIIDLQEKLQKCDLACADLRDENDELRMTIGDLEQRLDERIAKNEYYEKLCSDLEIRLDSSEKLCSNLEVRLEKSDYELHELNRQLEEVKNENLSSIDKEKLLHTTKIKDLEQELETVRQDLMDKLHTTKDLEKNTASLTDDYERSKAESDKLKISIRNLTEELQLNYVDNSKLRQELKKCEADLSAKDETVKILENLLKQSSEDKETLSKQMEEQRRSEKNSMLKTKAQLAVRVKELEEELGNVKRDFMQSVEKETTLQENYDALEENFQLIIIERDLLSKQKEVIRKDLDELKEVIETSQEVIDFLESDLQLTYSEMEELRRQHENDNDVEREVHRETTETRLKFKAYVAKMRSLQKDNERLADDLTELNEKCEDLKNEKFLLATELETLRSKVAADNDEHLALEESYKEMNKVYERSSKDSRTWLEKVSELEKSLEQKTQENIQCNEQLRQKGENLTSIRQQLDTISVECNQYKSQNRQLLEEKQEIESELQKLWRQESLLKKLLADLETQFDAVNKEKTALTSQNLDYVDQVQQITGKIQALINEKDVLSNENLKLCDQLNLLESNSSEHTTGLAEQLASMKSLLHQEENQNTQWKSEVERLKVNCKDLLEDKKLMDDKLQLQSKFFIDERQQLTKDKESMEKLFETKTLEYKQLEQLLIQSNIQLQICFKQIQELSRSQQVKEQNADEIDTIEKLQNEKNDLIKFLNMEQSKCETLESELQDRQKVSDDLIQQLQLLSDNMRLTENRIEEVLNEKNHLEQQLTVMIVEKAQLDQDCCVLKKEEFQQMKELEEKFMDCLEKNKELEFQLTSLQNELDVCQRRSAEAEHIQQNQQDYIVQEHCNTIDNVRSMNEELQSKLVLKDSKIAMLGVELSDLRSKLENIQQNTELDSVIIDTPNENITNLYDQIKQLQTSHEALKLEKQKLSEERQTLCNEIINLNNRLTESESQVEAQKIVVDGMSHSIDEVIKENESMKQEINGGNDMNKLLYEKQASEEAYNQLSTYYNQLQNAYTILYWQLNEKQVSISELPTNPAPEVQNDSLKDEKIDLIGVHSAVPMETIPSLSKRSENPVTNSNFVDQQIVRKMEMKITDLEIEKEVLNARIAKLQKEKESAEFEANDEYEWKIQTLETEISSLLKKSSAQENAIELLKDEMETKERMFDEEKVLLMGKMDKSDNVKLVDNLHGKLQFVEDNNYSSQVDVPDVLNSSLVDELNGNGPNQVDTAGEVMNESFQKLRNDAALLLQLNTELKPAQNLHIVEKQKYEHDIFMLKEEVRGLSQHITTLVAEIDDYKMKYRRSEERTNAFDSYFEKLERQFKDTLGTDALLKEEIVGLKKLCQNFDVEKSKSDAKLAEELVEKTKLIDRIAFLEAESKEKSEKLSTLEAIMKQMMDNQNDNSSDLSKQFDELKLTLEVTTDEKNRLQSKLRNLLSDNDTLAIEKENFDASLKLLQDQLASVDSLKNVQSENEFLNNNLKETMSTLKIVQESLNLAQTENKRLSEKINNCYETIEVLNEQIKSYAEQTSASQDEAVGAKLECDMLQQKLSDLEEIFSNASMSNEELSSFWSNKCEQLEIELRANKAELEKLKCERSTFIENLEMMKNQMDGGSKITDSVKVDFESTITLLNDEKSKLLALLEEEKVSKFVLQGDLDLLHEANCALEESLKTVTSQLEQQNNRRSNESDSMLEQLQSLRTKYEDASKNMKQLETQFDSTKQELENLTIDRLSLLENVEKMKLQILNDQNTIQTLKSGMGQTVASVEEEKTNLLAKIEEERDAKLALQCDLDSLVAFKFLADESLKNLKNQFDSEKLFWQKEVSSLKEQLSGYSAQLHNTDEELSRLKVVESQLIVAHDEVKTLKAELSFIVASKNSSEEKLKNFTVQLEHEKDSWIEQSSSLKEQFSSCRLQLENTNKELTRLKGVESQLKPAQEQVADLKDELASTAGLMESMKLQFGKEQKKSESLQIELEENVSSLEIEVSQLLVQLKEERETKLKLQSFCSELEASKTVLEDSLQNFAGQFENGKPAASFQSNTIDDEVSSYKVLLNEANEQLDRLKGENIQLAKGTKEIAEEFEKVKLDYNRKMVSLKEINQQMTDENKLLSNALCDTDASCTRFKEKIHELTIELAEKNQITEQIQLSATELSSTKDHVQQLAKEKEYLIGQLNDAKTSFGQMKNECHMLKSEIEKVSAERSANTKLIEDLKRASHDAQSMVALLEHERSTLSKVQRETGELREQLSHTERQLDSCRSKLSEVDTLKEKLKETEIKLERLVSEKRGFSSSDQKNKAEISKLSQELAAYQNEKINLSRKLEESIQECLRHQDKCRLLEAAQSKAVSSTHSTTMSYEEDYKRLSKENIQLQDKLKELQTKFDQMKAGTSATEKQTQKLHDEVQRVVKFPEAVHNQSGNIKDDLKSHTKIEMISSLDVNPRQRHSSPSSQMLDSGVEVGTDDDKHAGGVPLLSDTDSETIFGSSSSISLALNPSSPHQFQLWCRRMLRRRNYLSWRRLSLLKMFVFTYLLLIHVFLFACWLR